MTSKELHVIDKRQWIGFIVGRRLWVRATVFALVGVVLALIAMAAHYVIPENYTHNVAPDAARVILTILASSMLAVTTFSLSIMVSALSGASNVSPRAASLLVADHTTQNVLAIFIGAFLFSLAGLIVLNLGFYDAQGELALFFVSILMVIAVVIAILRWIDHLTFFGRSGDTINRVEAVTINALRDRMKNPCLGGNPLLDGGQIPESAIGVFAEQVGYVDFLDMEALEKFAERRQIKLYLEAIPGSFVHHRAPLLYMDTAISNEERAHLVSAFHLGNDRNYLQDPRFGLAVMAEIASRGLSSAINDTGTPIDIVGRGLRIFSYLQDRVKPETARVHFPNLYVPPMPLSDLFEDFFLPIARDGAGIIEVQIRLHKALLALDALGDAEISAQAQRHRQIALAYAEQKLILADELARLKAVWSARKSYPRRLY
jgi:uncharacterized membrane protein